MFGKYKDMTEVKEKRWSYSGKDRYIRRQYECSDGSTIYCFRDLHWYNRWFIKLMNRNKPRDTRTLQQMMNDCGILRMSSPQLGVDIINFDLINKRKESGEHLEL